MRRAAGSSCGRTVNFPACTCFRCGQIRSLYHNAVRDKAAEPRVLTVAHVTYAFMDKAAEPLFISGGSVFRGVRAFLLFAGLRLQSLYGFGVK